MNIENLEINRLCIHRVPQRSLKGQRATPIYNKEILTMDYVADEEFKKRICQAFDRNAKCMDMRLTPNAVKDIIEPTELVLDSTEDEPFINRSCRFADDLAKYQDMRSPAGVLIFFDGTLGSPKKRFFALLKADFQNALSQNDESGIDLITDIFLSQKSRLYKIGLFVEDITSYESGEDTWKASVYDDQLSANTGEGAAAFFYKDFLKLVYLENSALIVRKFFIKVKEFINNCDICQENKADLHNSLYDYLKVNKGNTISVNEFSNLYFEEKMKASFEKYMEKAGVPMSDIPKDISSIEKNLKRRRICFPKDIQLSGPSDAIRELVTFKEVTKDTGKVNTLITIDGSIKSQE